MDEYTADAFANRDEPVPLLTVTLSDAEESLSKVDKFSKRDKLKRPFSSSKLKAKPQDGNDAHIDQTDSTSGNASLQDRLFAKYVSYLTMRNEMLSGPGCCNKSSHQRMSIARLNSHRTHVHRNMSDDQPSVYLL